MPRPERPSSRVQIRVRGAVQGVGFRPFVHRLATRHRLSGFVLNDGEGVLLEAEGDQLDGFIGSLSRERPPLARIDALAVRQVPAEGGRGFEIRDSQPGAPRTHIVPDAATCAVCLDDLFDPRSRFYLYPFVTCPDCGPRFTIAHRLPYDRANTAMRDFPLCAACLQDYRDSAGRRFHAETIACPTCGPHLDHPMAAIATAVRDGRIVALKGIGGFHLICDAANEVSIAALRQRKSREAKPFAIMVANLASVDLFAMPTEAERVLLIRRERPIVLLRRRPGLAPSIAPGLSRIGVMLAYAPVHHLLFHALAGSPGGTAWRAAPVPCALVATSANFGGEPLLADDDEARTRLSGIADLIVGHDRRIVARVDDSVMTIIDGAPAFIRRARGFAPEPIDLGADGPCVVGVGGHLKTTVTVTRGREAFVSPHIGDLDSPTAIRFHQETIRHLLAILDVRPDAIAHDLHPDFHSTRFAEASGLPMIGVQHHAAHIASLLAEHRVEGPVLGLALDGYGRGDDGGAWGGELIWLNAAQWRRLGHLYPLALAGGDRAAREPWRMGIAALAALGQRDAAGRYFPTIALAEPLARTLADTQAVPTTTSMGRLFDAAAALLGLRYHQSFEGQAAMELEALVDTPRSLPNGFRLEGNALDFRPLLAELLMYRGDPVAGAALFHGTLIDGLSAWAGAAAVRLELRIVALGGGCLMNRVLADGLAAALRQSGLTVLLPRAVPANDGGLSLGQAWIARKTLAEGIV